jgi:threonine aldolase
LVPTGTAANALAVSCLVPSHGAVFCHEVAHVETMESGAVSFYSGGAKLLLLPGSDGKISVEGFLEHLAAIQRRPDQLPKALTLTQLTEAGTAYNLAEIAALAGHAKKNGLKVHMDGSRFSNALIALGCSPADMTWKSGVDILSFGCTKNGTMGADAVLSFDPELSELLKYRRKRGGLFMSKSRFIAAQILAYLEDDLWLQNARHANAMGRRLAEGLANLDSAKIVYPVDGNIVFVTLPDPVVDALLSEGFRFSRRGRFGEMIRLVTSFATEPSDVDAFIASTGLHLADRFYW